MAKAKRVTYFKAKIEDKPGSLLALAKDLKAKNLGLIGLKGVGQAGQGEILVIAKSPDKLRDAWKASGALAEEGTAFFVSGEDKTGALVASLDAIAKAGVNIVATEAIAVGGKFGVILWVSPEDLDKTAQALGAK
jgi:prephenate dehydratase